MNKKIVSLQCYGSNSSYDKCKNPVVGRVDEPDRRGIRPLRCQEHGGNPDTQCVIDAYVDWHDGWANTPSLALLLNHHGNFEGPIWEQRGPLFYAENNGVVRFHSYLKPDQGFGGAMFKGTLTNGESFEHKGPWSASAGAMNRVGFGPCVDVSLAYMDDDFSGGGVAVFEKGYTFMGGAVTLALVQEALVYHCQGIGLMWVDATLVPVKLGITLSMVPHLRSRKRLTLCPANCQLNS